MSGYSIKLSRIINAGDKSLLGKTLGRACLAADYPITKVATRLGVSRQTVYNWFYGECNPSEDRTLMVKELIDELR
jgi:predicted transcriptional regulator